MLSLGIDLAAQAKDTAYCQVQWLADMALVELPVAGADDVALLDAMEAADWSGIDAPLGWPEPFVRAIGHYMQHAEWPADATPPRMRYRETDRFVRELVKAERGIAISPLSVSSNWIASCSWRCGNLLRTYRDRTGHELDRIAVPSRLVSMGHPMSGARLVSYLNGPEVAEYINNVYERSPYGGRLRVRAAVMTDVERLFAEALRSFDRRLRIIEEER